MTDYILENIKLNQYVEDAVKNMSRGGWTKKEILLSDEGLARLKKYAGIGTKTIKNLKKQRTNLKMEYMKKRHIKN